MSKSLAIILECVLCGGNFNQADAEKGRYYLATQVCERCYQRGAKESRKVWCFGKKQQRGLVGFSTKNVECRTLCPDRVICREFITRRTKENG